MKSSFATSYDVKAGVLSEGDLRIDDEEFLREAFAVHIINIFAIKC